MRHLTLAALAAATFAAAAALSPAQAYNGPHQNGAQCWHATNGTGLGYWTQCPNAAKASNASAIRPTPVNQGRRSHRQP
jgi:hypothetical protein